MDCFLVFAILSVIFRYDEKISIIDVGKHETVRESSGKSLEKIEHRCRKEKKENWRKCAFLRYINIDVERIMIVLTGHCECADTIRQERSNKPIIQSWYAVFD